MIKITQNEVTKNFTVTVSKFETIKETYQVASQVQRILAKSGVVSTSTKNGEFVVDFSSYNDNITVDNVLWLLVDGFNVGYHDDLGIYIESLADGVSVATNKDGSTVKLKHKNAYKLRQDSEFPYTFAGGLQYFQIFQDTVRIDFPSSHINALQVAQDLLDLLDSLS